MSLGGIAVATRFGVSRRRQRTVGRQADVVATTASTCSPSGARRLSLGPRADPQLGHLRPVHLAADPPTGCDLDPITVGSGVPAPTG